MFKKLLAIEVFLLIYATSAKFNLNSLNTTNKSLDTLNQTEITLTNTWDYNDAKDDDEDDPITWKPKENEHGKLLLNNTTKSETKYLSLNQKPFENKNLVEQQQPNRNHQQNLNYFYHYLTTLKFNNRNNENNNRDYLNKQKTITGRKRQEDAKTAAKQKAPNDRAEQTKLEDILENFKGKYQTKYYTPPNSLSNEWLGQLPQTQLQPQQLQLFLQQQLLLPLEPSTTSSAAEAASSLPQEYHHLTDYRILFNAERHTQFYLHTLTTTTDYVAHATKRTGAAAATQAPLEVDIAHNLNDNDYNYNYFYDVDDDDDASDNKDNDEMPLLNLTNPRVLNYVTDTIGAVFGVNTRPVANIQGIHIEEIELYNSLSLRQSRFNPFNPCRILIHGWLGDSKAGIYNTLVPEYFKLQQGSYNIITVDWGKGAIADYITASYRVKPVGIVVAKFIDFLHQQSGIPFESIHVIGFSMGAHIAGLSGKYVKTGRLPVIYGLDPALPLFRYENKNERLDVSDADYVEVIHTSVGSYGYDHPLGHVDFYVNFGYNQPGCFFNECSHFRSFQIYAQSLRNEMLEGAECSRELWFDMIRHKRCLREMGRSLRLGVEGLKRKTLTLRRGLYYVLTNAQVPYRVG